MDSYSMSEMIVNLGRQRDILISCPSLGKQNYRAWNLSATDTISDNKQYDLLLELTLTIQNMFRGHDTVGRFSVKFC